MPVSVNENSSASEEYLEGTVERITFHSEESGFCVLRVNVKGVRDLTTVIGSSVFIVAGEFVRCRGRWTRDRKHGVQFSASELKTVPPSTIEGMTKYLGSGMIKGVGPHFAKRLTDAFGEDVFDIIENSPERLSDLDGIGKVRRERITESWTEQKAVREIMVFLSSHGVGTSRAVRIYKIYGDDSIGLIRKNPYQLALDIHGIGFKSADRIAMSLGIDSHSLIRARAGVRHAVMEICSEGHCAAPYDLLVSTSVELLQIPDSIVRTAAESEMHQQNLTGDTVNGEFCVYPASLYRAEISVAESISRLNRGMPSWGHIDTSKALPWVEKNNSIKFSESQRKAVELTVNSRVSVITGGPGVGKTTVVNSILKIITAKRAKVVLCAPTGRAAKRLAETTDMKALTIHRLLKFDPKTGSFKFNRDNPLDIDFAVVDEASMIDTVLMHSFLRAIPDRASVLIVGDIDQLPSVGSGSVLRDIINSGTVAVSMLSEIFRQAQDSMIVVNAHRINRGAMSLPNRNNGDFFVIVKDEPEEIFEELISVVTERLPAKYGLDPVRDIQVLSPMNRGGLGCTLLNCELQKRLNPGCGGGISRFGSEYAQGDKVIQNVNNYDKNVFNGDMGIIKSISIEDSSLCIEFDGRDVLYEFHELDEINLAYAATIHKSQGSEYPAVVIPLASQHYLLLQRNLLYTGVTRGRQLVVVICQKKALAMAVKNFRTVKRITKLEDRLKFYASDNIQTV